MNLHPEPHTPTHTSGESSGGPRTHLGAVPGAGPGAEPGAGPGAEPGAEPGAAHSSGTCSLLGQKIVAGEDGSVATEYGLLAVVAATIVAVVLEWATSGGITGLLESVLARVSQLVGL